MGGCVCFDRRKPRDGEKEGYDNKDIDTMVNQVFKQYDRDHDGRLDREDISQLVKDMC